MSHKNHEDNNAGTGPQDGRRTIFSAGSIPIQWYSRNSNKVCPQLEQNSQNVCLHFCEQKPCINRKRFQFNLNCAGRSVMPQGYPEPVTGVQPQATKLKRHEKQWRTERQQNSLGYQDIRCVQVWKLLPGDVTSGSKNSREANFASYCCCKKNTAEQNSRKSCFWEPLELCWIRNSHVHNMCVWMWIHTFWRKAAHLIENKKHCGWGWAYQGLRNWTVPTGLAFMWPRL